MTASRPRSAPSFISATTTRTFTSSLSAMRRTLGKSAPTRPNAKRFSMMTSSSWCSIHSMTAGAHTCFSSIHWASKRTAWWPQACPTITPSTRTLNTPPRFDTKPAKMDLGLDTKAILKDSLVLDFTLNPDFSQVESDEPQVTVNQRFEVFFPEKRPFFLENSTFFQTPINLLFARRIADPQYGARMTVKLGHYELGAFFIDERAPG